MRPEELERLVRSAHTMLEETIADRMVLLLNELLELDYEATVALVFGPHIPCNQAIADHPSVQVGELPPEYQKGERKWGVRVMGLLNGIAGQYPDGYGRICGVFEVACPQHGVFNDENGDPVLLSRTMPGGGICVCGKKLELGKLVRFSRIPPEEHGVTPPVADENQVH